MKQLLIKIYFHIIAQFNLLPNKTIKKKEKEKMTKIPPYGIFSALCDPAKHENDSKTMAGDTIRERKMQKEKGERKKI